jgi:hypothetical protein
MYNSFFRLYIDWLVTTVLSVPVGRASTLAFAAVKLLNRVFGGDLWFVHYPGVCCDDDNRLPTWRELVALTPQRG